MVLLLFALKFTIVLCLAKWQQKSFHELVHMHQWDTRHLQGIPNHRKMVHQVSEPVQTASPLCNTIMIIGFSVAYACSPLGMIHHCAMLKECSRTWNNLNTSEIWMKYHVYLSKDVQEWTCVGNIEPENPNQAYCMTKYNIDDCIRHCWLLLEVVTLMRASALFPI